MASPAVLSLIIKRHTVCKAWMPPLESGVGMFTTLARMSQPDYASTR